MYKINEETEEQLVGSDLLLVPIHNKRANLKATLFLEGSAVDFWEFAKLKRLFSKSELVEYIKDNFATIDEAYVNDVDLFLSSALYCGIITVINR